MNFLKKIQKSLSLYQWPVRFEIEEVMPNSMYNLKYGNCVIELFWDTMYYSVDCFIYHADNPQKKYGIGEIARANSINLGPADIELFNQAPSPQKIEKYLNQQLNVINKKFMFVVLGDFSWVNKIEEYRQNSKYIQDSMGTWEAVNHPIYKKFEKGDESWRADLEEWKKMNNE